MRTDPLPGTTDGLGATPFAIDLEVRGAALVAMLRGDLDLGAADRFDQLLEPMLAEPLADVVIDLRGVQFMDSTGLRLLLTADRIARDRELRLWIVRGGPELDKVLRITGMDKVLPIVGDPPDVGG